MDDGSVHDHMPGRHGRLVKGSGTHDRRAVMGEVQGL